MITGNHVKDLADGIQKLLERFADKKGVKVMFHKTEPRIRFDLITDDKIVIEVDYEINKTSKDYIDAMLQNIIQATNQRRKERHESTIIIT